MHNCVCVCVSFLILGVDIQHGVELPRLVAQQSLEVADEAVDISLARRLVDDVLVVVVAQAAAKLLVVHLGLVLPSTPQKGYLRTCPQPRGGQGQVMALPP